MYVLRGVYNNGMQATRMPIGTDRKGAFERFERMVASIENCTHYVPDHIERIELKQGRTVLCMQRFGEGKRL